MTGSQESRGHGVAVTGAVLLGVSLWLPWYTLQIPAAAADSLDQLSQQLGSFGSLLRAGVQLAQQLGPIHVTAWHSLSTIPGVALGVAVIAGGTSMLALSGRANNVAGLTALAGAVGLVLVGYRILVHPLGGLLHPAWGIYMAGVGAVAILAGGVIAGQDRVTSSVAPTLYELDPYPAEAASGWATTPEAASGWSPASSVPPPGA